MDAKFIDDLTRRLSAVLPKGTDELQRDLEKNIRTVMQSAFSRLDLVSREEYEVQSQVLARTRSKLETLEKQVEELEKKLR